jgi:hypothetical protein
MSKRNEKKLVSISPLSIFGAIVAISLSGCSLIQESMTGNVSNSSGSKVSVASGSDDPLYGEGTNSVSTSVPSDEAIVGRIQKGLPSVNPNAGQFKAALAQVSSNLPTVTDPIKATGLEQIPLLVYAACTDVNPSTYKINIKQSVSANTAQLIDAGIQMVNQHVANLAATGSLNQQVSAVFSKLIQDDVAAGASTAMTFVSVCLAANSFGVGMMGF